MNDDPVDFDAVKRNAKLDGIALSEITITYKNLTPNEIELLRQNGVLINTSDDTTTGNFTSFGEAILPEKAYGVFCLGA